MRRGKATVDVTFNLDANGVLSVSALEKSTGRSRKIEIANDSSRLSDDEVARLVEEAQRYAAEDDANKIRIESKFNLENYVYSLKSSMSDQKVIEQLTDDDKESITYKIEETENWLLRNQLAEKDEFEAIQQELEEIANPILNNLNSGGEGDGGGGTRDDDSDDSDGDLPELDTDESDDDMPDLADSDDDDTPALDDLKIDEID
eukprot:CAMPEP_0114366910 /NCGR_PEP_ID=MMETSP0101-20121206/29668_1 /TAXON_ID=38822 ORGANISM="Pteridomonas danica, Strain PT" /NCGR_SAMPLE_ID=MMETSP0101 /ASSEMBLY_ACC=CAM_ASM_000211 /LENGTH=203 /DNA_ID=CAMNT_0001516283 /DNA_START=512 /DNA_END=1123 /DNA_ORIENTATION=-